jgi:Ni2+-binding GTPase involved in maturation of urease and hydrogenase
MKHKSENILLIAGCGQNVGKTTLICQILQNQILQNPIAIKTTPHFHKITQGLVEIEKGKNWTLFEESDKTTQKDSSLYLQNGAVKSYLIQSDDAGLQEAFSALKNFLPDENPIIIESAALTEIIQPGFFVMILPEGECKKKKMGTKLNKADLIVISDGNHFYPSPEKIIFNNSWRLK